LNFEFWKKKDEGRKEEVEKTERKVRARERKEGKSIKTACPRYTTLKANAICIEAAPNPVRPVYHVC
jgi:hypothetical protein